MIIKFDEITRNNIIEDYKNLVTQIDSGAPYSDEINKLCFIWFTMGHVNSLDTNSTFSKNFNGDSSNTKVH